MSELRNKLIDAISEINSSEDISAALEITEDWINDVYYEISNIIDGFSINSIDNLDNINTSLNELKELKDKLY